MSIATENVAKDIGIIASTLIRRDRKYLGLSIQNSFSKEYDVHLRHKA